MRPVAFDGCFGWLHTQAEADGANTAVLLCAGVAQDKQYGHRPLRQLADALAGAGYPTLRFDYPDTGDSIDVGGDAEHWTLWLQSIETAIDWLRAHTGATRIVLVGVRLGGMLAAVVAERREDVAALVLLEPVLRGRTYIRQLSVEILVSRSAGARKDGGLDVQGVLLSSETIRQIGKIDLQEVLPRATCPVGLFCQSMSPVVSAAVETWRTAGAAVSCETFEGLAPFLRPTFMNHEGSADPTHLVGWLRRTLPPRQLAAAMPHLPEGAYIPLHTDAWVETPLFFGERGHLFGMVCRPQGRALAGFAVVILNAGGDPHYGNGRLSLAFARRLAAEGIVSLRMDFAGLGDAVGSAQGVDIDCHIMEQDRTADIAAALDAMEAAGYHRFALHGLCTGAYHALHGAIEDRRVDTLLLVNLPTFTWQKGDPVETIGVHGLKHYLHSLRQPSTWLSILFGRFSLLRPVYGLRNALVLYWNSAPWRTRRREDRRASLGFAQRCMRIVARRKIRTLLLYASEDAGLDVLRREFGPRGVRLANVVVRVTNDIDHSLSRSTMRRIAIDQMIDFLDDAPPGFGVPKRG